MKAPPPPEDKKKGEDEEKEMMWVQADRVDGSRFDSLVVCRSHSPSFGRFADCRSVSIRMFRERGGNAYE